ncbi:uncharacterized protein LOC126162726 [Schistocerca cancellata]|uniref:uncharacterized protein LOC126162726 n=1 Tax=Schistocerca cancellata TaxID=274614 RepID=UPI002118C268|nr:uncharacterized protein LOC126162726 [Schistocerca cancellata]
MVQTGVSFNVPSISKSDAEEIPPVIAHAQQCDTDRLKTTEIVMGWPIVYITLNKIQKFYETLRSSNRIITWSCDVSEKLVTTLYERSAPVRATMCPAIRIVDLVTTDVVETVQKKLPVVRQSPSKVYEAMKSGFYKRIAHVWDETEFLVHRGERRFRKVAVLAAEVLRKSVVTLDKWMEKVEEYVENAHSKRLKQPQVPGDKSLTDPVETKSWAPVKTAFNWATTVAMFSLGAAACITSRVPLVGRFVSLSTSPMPSTSASPTSEKDLKSSSSSYESIPESTAAATTAKMRRSQLNLENQSL